MDSYKVIISPKALSQIVDYVDYLRYTLLNEQAAIAVWADALETVTRLKTIAGSIKPCEHERLKEYGYRIILFSEHRYVMLYRIVDSTAYIDAVYHELQDYQNLFAKELI